MSVPDIVRVTPSDRGEREPLLILEPLEAFLDSACIGSGKLDGIAPLGDGHSNVTFVARRGDLEIVLRRPPRGPLPPSAHDVVREARIMRGLAPAVPVPEILAICDDASVIGAPFVVMRKVDGWVLNEALPAEISAGADRRRIGEQVVDALVDLHAVDPRRVTFGGRVAGGDYLERQLRRFAGLWGEVNTRQIAAVDELHRGLAAHVPEQAEVTVVHGDYRLGNVMFAPFAPARLVAILDWEMSTLGDPLADLGYLAATWVDRDDPPGPFQLSPVSRDAGFLSRGDLIRRYTERSGRPIDRLAWYQALALWKASIFMEGNYRRALQGTTDDAFLRDFGDDVEPLALRGLDILAGG